MDKAMGFNPKPFQLKVASHIIRMKHRSLVLPHPTASLLVQGTGGGKTSVYQTIGVIKCGINLIIQNILTLSSDQHERAGVRRVVLFGFQSETFQLFDGANLYFK